MTRQKKNAALASRFLPLEIGIPGQKKIPTMMEEFEAHKSQFTRTTSAQLVSLAHRARFIEYSLSLMVCMSLKYFQPSGLRCFVLLARPARKC